MSDNPLSGKVGLDVTDFKSGIATLNREIRVIESGFKAAAAGMGDWDKKSGGLELRIKALNSQIELQKSKVAALDDIYKKVVAEKGATSKAAQDLQIRLNKENETLGKMQVELRESNTALENMGKEEKTTGDKTKDLDSAEDKAAKSTTHFGDTLKSLAGHAKNAANGIINLIGHVAKLAAGLALGLTISALGALAAIGALVLKSGEWADKFATLAGQTRLYTTRLQELDYIGKKLDVDLNTIATSQAKMTRNMAGSIDGTGDAADAFKKLGIRVTDSNGNLRDSKVVFGEIIDALGKIQNPTESDALAMALFGKSAMELNPLIDAGADKLAKLAEEANRVGAVMSEKDVEALDQFKDSSDALGNTIKGITGHLAAQFAPVLSLGIKLLNDFLADPKTHAGLDKLAGGLSTIAGIVSKAMTADNPIFALGLGIEKAGKGSGILTTLGQGLEKLGYIVPRLQAAFKSGGIGGLFKALIPSGGVTGILSGLGETIGKLLSNMLTGFASKPASLMKIGLDIIQGLGTGLTTAIPALLPVFMGLLTSLVAFITQMLPTLIQTGLTIVMQLAMGIMQAIPSLVPVVITIITNFVQFLVQNLPMLITAAIGMIVALATGIAQALPTLIPAVIGIIPVIVITLLENLPLLVGAALTLIIALAQGLIAAIPVLLPQIPIILKALVDAITTSLPMIGAAALTLITTLATGLIENLPLIATTVVSLIDTIVKGVKDLATTIWQVGTDIVTGVWNGIVANKDKFLTDIKKFFTDIIDGVKDILHIKSPSGIFMDLGDKSALGFGKGFTGQFRNIQEQVMNAIRGMSGMAISANVTTGFGHQLQPAMAGDTIIQNFYDQGTAALGMAMVDERRRARLNATMGG